MAEKRFSELTTAGALTGAELLAMSQETLGSLLSVKSTLQNIANWFAVNSQYASALDTTDKTLCGAINELKQLISLIPQFSIEVVQTLPTEDISETTIYLVPSSDPEQGNYYEEYIYVNNTWELVGTTAVDLSAYYTKLDVDGLLAAKANTSDVTAALALKEAKADLDDDVTDIVVGLTDEQTTAPGNPVTLTTEQSGGAKSALVTFAPKQSGTGDPSPTNIRPISGWDGLSLTRTGKNVCPIDYIGTSTSEPFTLKADTYSFSFTLKGTARYTTSNISIRDSSGVSVIASIPVYNKSVGEKLSASFTITEEITLAIFNANVLNDSDGKSADDIQIEYGESATDYVPFQGITTHTATFPDTVYSGTWNPIEGKAYINKWYCDMGDLTYAQGEGYLQVSKDSVQTLTGKNPKRETASSTLGLNISEICPVQGTVNQFRFNTNLTKAEFEAIAGGHLFVYELETPTEITLTPEDIELLKGLNIITTDGDTVQVKYSELPNGNLGAVIDYIKKLEARVKALES